MIKRKIIEENIGVITIKGPKSLNFLNPQLLKDINTVINNFFFDEKIRVIIITGGGEKSFIAGADIKYMQNLDSKSAFKFGQLGQKLTNNIENAPKPIIAAVNGFALGGGCEIAMSCQIRFASENAKFAQPEVKLGIIPGWGGTQRLRKIVGIGIANEIIISGEMIDSEKALQIGLVNKVFPSNILLDETIKFAKIILKNSPSAIEKSIKSINNSFNLDPENGLKEEVKLFSKLFDTVETKEGISAFAQRRKPDFSI